MPVEVIFVVFVILFGCATAYMSLPPPNYGLGSPCLSCRDRKDSDGVWRWSAEARHFPLQSAAAKLRLLKWVQDMSQSVGVCNECSRVLNMVAIEMAIMATDQR